jgi:SAM-dependent MidA family methyltransferase
MTNLKLPTPSPEAVAHSAKLSALIHAEISAQGGAMPFDRYFELCQYAPGLGYYSAGLRKFGAGGDFVTAPELGDVFARCLAHSILPTLRACTSPCILEVGCGTGAMAADILQALALADALPERYLMLERSADLRARQQETLAARVPAYLSRVHWLDAPPDFAWSGVILGNEIVDALPAKRFEITADSAQELCVQSHAQGFAYCLGADLPLVNARLGDALYAKLAPGYRSEIQAQLGPWLAGLCAHLQQGLVLLFDYGYPRRSFYLPERDSGTFVCHYQQRMFDDPFWYPGLVDFSSSVDFTALAEASVAAKLALAAYLSQAEFLLQGALPTVLANLADLSERERLNITRQVRMLSLPGEMGERIQLMAFARELPESARAPVLQRFGLRASL